MDFSLKNKNNLEVLESTFRSDKFLIKMVFTSRKYGYSEGLYSSLNMGEHVGDDYNLVYKNQEQLLNNYDFTKKDVYYGEQTHGTNISVITGNSPHKLLDTDGLCTIDSARPLMSFYADCVPLYFFDKKQGAIGLAHAGWRGTVKEIGPKMLATFQSTYKSDLDDLIVIIGPSICKSCYQVDEKVYQEFVDIFEQDITKICEVADKGKYNLDLWLANKILLNRFGLNERNIYTMNLCSACNEDLFFSYRRDGSITGRMASLIYKESL